MPEVIPSNPTITPGSLPNLAGAGSLMPGAGVEVQTAPGVPTPGTITPVTPETPGMFPGAAPDVHPATPGLFPGDPPSGTPEAPEPPPSGDPYALKSRKVTGGGIATGGGDLSGDRVITVTEASQAQAEAGTAANVVVTPRRMKQSMEAWLAGLTAADVGADVAGAAAAAQAYAVQRANHTGTQSADTVVDGATNKAFTAAEKSKLAGIATGATVANATNIGGAIAGVTTKATPVDADSLWITDSAAGNAARRVLFSSLRTWVTGVVNTWWGSLTTAVKTTGDQSISGLKTFATSPRSTGTPATDSDLLNRGQGDARWQPKSVRFIRSVTNDGSGIITQTFEFTRAQLGIPAGVTFAPLNIEVRAYYQGARSYLNAVFGTTAYDDQTDFTEVRCYDISNIVSVGSGIEFTTYLYVGGSSNPLKIDVTNSYLGFATNDAILFVFDIYYP